MASSVEVLEIECVVINLFNRGAVKSICAHFEFNDKYYGASNDDYINSLTHPWYRELEIDPALYCGWQMAPQKLYLALPCMLLLVLQSEPMLHSERTHDRVFICSHEVRD